MFNTTIDPWQKSFLHCGIDEVVASEIVGETLSENEMECFANTSCEGNHPKVFWVRTVSFFVNGFYN